MNAAIREHDLPPILVLFGGRSEEAEVSVVSGTAIAAALLDLGAHGFCPRLGAKNTDAQR